jgi:1-acyl-sn-glycerol-3-phosphate acyltransferase
VLLRTARFNTGVSGKANHLITTNPMSFTRFFKKLHYFLVMFNMVLFFFLLYLPLYYFSRKPERYWGMVMLRRWWGFLSTFFAGIFFRFEFEAPIDWNKTYVICPYHTSNLDTAMISILVKSNNFCIMGKEDLKDNLLTGMFFRTVDLPVDRKSKIAAYRAFRTASEKLANGASMVMFPEGGIADQYPPQVQEFKSGPFRLAIERKITVLPISSQNTWELFWDDGRKYGSRPGVARVFIHKPVETAHLNLGDEDALMNEVKKIIENKIKSTAD